MKTAFFLIESVHIGIN